jgi:hypothetical protein
MFGATADIRGIEGTCPERLGVPSGSQSLLPSSSYDTNFALREEAATINDVLGSNTTWEYALDGEIVREGISVPSCKSGIHSRRLGP